MNLINKTGIKEFRCTNLMMAHWGKKYNRDTKLRKIL